MYTYETMTYFHVYTTLLIRQLNTLESYIWVFDIDSVHVSA